MENKEEHITTHATNQDLGLGQRDPIYGGIITDISALPTGTEFFVKNGFWNGKIVEIAGKRLLEIHDVAGHFISRIPIKRNGEHILSVIIAEQTEGKSVSAQASMKYIFMMVIGDWSCDGHEKSAAYSILSNKSIEQVRMAHFAIKEKLGFDIEAMCSSYGDDVPTTEQIDTLVSLGIDVPVHAAKGINAEDMAHIWTALLQEADPELRLTFNDADEKPMLHFYGFDHNGNHIGSVGYGLF